MKNSCLLLFLFIALLFSACNLNPNPSEAYQSGYQSAGDGVSGMGVTPNGPGDDPGVVNTGYQFSPAIVKDKLGHYMITWVDMRSGNFGVYARSFYTAWSTYFGDNKMDDTVLQDGPIDQYPQVAVDSKNNYYVLYAVQNGNLRLKKFTNYGSRITNVQADTAAFPSDWANYDLAVDSNDNIFVVYQKPAASGGGSYIAKFDSNCVKVWGDKNAGGLGGNPAIAIRGGNIYIATAGGNITRIDTDGNMIWKITVDAPERLRIAVDMANNVCAVYNYNFSVYYARYDANGNTVTAPILVSAQGRDIEKKDYADIDVDTNNNKFLVFRDRYNTEPSRPGFDRTIRAQKLTASDTAAWTAGGVEVCRKDSVNQQVPAVCANGTGGAAVIWYDNRAGVAAAYIYANEIVNAGTRKFTTDIQVSASSSSSSSSSAIPAPVAGLALMMASSSSSSSAYALPEYVYAYPLLSETLSECVNWDYDTVFGIWTDYGAGAVIEPITTGQYEAYSAIKVTGTGTWMGVSIGVKDTAVLKNLSPFQWGSIKLSYKGKKTFKIGVKSGGVVPRERWLTLTNGRFGFYTNNNWCQVSIPMTFFYGVNFSSIEQYLMIVAETNYGYETGAVYTFDHIFYTTNQTSGGPVPNTNVNESNTVCLYSETTPITVNWDVDTKMEIWNGTLIEETSATAGEGQKSWNLKGVADWMGIAIRVEPATLYRDLTRFTNGSLKFKFKGTQPLKVGIKSGPTGDHWLTPAELFRFGMTTNNAWCQVSLPLSMFTGVDFSKIQYYFMTTADATIQYVPGLDYYIDDLYWTTNTTPGGPTNVDAANTFCLYSDGIPQDVIYDTDTKIDIWSDWGAGMTIDESLLESGEGAKSWKFTGTGTWMGLGIRVEPLSAVADLSAYSAGKLNFMFRGKKIFKVGIKSSLPAAVEKWIVMTNGKYGFVTNDTWCSVSIPMTVFAGVNFSKVQQYFMWAADAPLSYTIGSTYKMDNIYFSK